MSDKISFVQVFSECWRSKFGVNWIVSPKELRALRDVAAACAGNELKFRMVCKLFLDERDKWIIQRGWVPRDMLDRLNGYFTQIPSNPIAEPESMEAGNLENESDAKDLDVFGGAFT